MPSGEKPRTDFPRHERIARRNEFTAAYSEGTKQFGRFSVVFVRPNQAGHARIGITVTRKCGKAHVRNRLKRWVREIYRNNRERLGFSTKPLDFVVNVRPSASATEFEAFSTDLIRTLSRAAAAAETTREST